MDQRRRADQAQRTNSLIEVHTKKWGGATKGPFKVRGFLSFVLPTKGLSCLDEIKLSAIVFSAMPIRFNNHNRNQSAAHFADVFRSCSIRISNQKCAMQKTSTTPSATIGRHSLESTINVPLPANPIITTAVPQRRQQARREKNPFARNASLTLGRHSRVKVRGFPLPRPMATRRLQRSVSNCMAQRHSVQVLLILKLMSVELRDFSVVGWDCN